MLSHLHSVHSVSQLFSFVRYTQVEQAVAAMSTPESKDISGTETQPVRTNSNPTVAAEEQSSKKQWWHRNKKSSDEGANFGPDIAAVQTEEHEVKKPWWHSIKEPGSALQIIAAALLAIAIGLIVTTQVEKVPDAARVLISIPGDLWLRSLKAVGESPDDLFTLAMMPSKCK